MEAQVESLGGSHCFSSFGGHIKLSVGIVPAFDLCEKPRVLSGHRGSFLPSHRA